MINISNPRIPIIIYDFIPVFIIIIMSVFASLFSVFLSSNCNSLVVPLILTVLLYIPVSFPVNVLDKINLISLSFPGSNSTSSKDKQYKLPSSPTVQFLFCASLNVHPPKVSFLIAVTYPETFPLLLTLIINVAVTSAPSIYFEAISTFDKSSSSYSYSSVPFDVFTLILLTYDFTPISNVSFGLSPIFKPVTSESLISTVSDIPYFLPSMVLLEIIFVNSLLDSSSYVFILYNSLS